MESKDLIYTNKGKYRATEKYAEQESGCNPYFSDFQLNPFPPGYTALNKLLEKSISKIWKNAKECDSCGGEIEFPKEQALSH